EDRSSRSGRDSYFLWSFHFERRNAHGAELVAVAADVSYFEPWATQESCEVETQWTAEIFQTGQVSRFKREGTRKIPIGAFLRDDLAAIVQKLIHEAEHVLPCNT